MLVPFRLGVMKTQLCIRQRKILILVIDRSNEINPSYREILGRTQDISFNGYLDAENGK